MPPVTAALPVPLPRAPARIALIEGERAVQALEQFGPGTRPGNVFHSSALLHAAAANNVSCLAASISRDGSTGTLWPLRLVRDMGISIATDLCDPISQYSDVIGEPMDGAALVELGQKLRKDFGVDALLARRVRTDSGLHEGFAEANATILDENVAPFADLEAFGNFENYLSNFSKSAARKIRQRRQRLQQDHGALSFGLVHGESARGAIQLATTWKRNWLDAQALSSRVFDGAANEAALVEASIASNAHVSVMHAGHRPIAIELGFSCGRHYAAYLGTFDPSFAPYSAGQEQMLRTIEWCFAQGFTRYDLLPPADRYKLHWTRSSTAEPVRDYGIALSRVGSMYLFVRRHARARVQRTVEAMPAAMRHAAKRYGKVAIGIGGTAAAIGLLND